MNTKFSLCSTTAKLWLLLLFFVPSLMVLGQQKTVPLANGSYKVTGGNSYISVFEVKENLVVGYINGKAEERFHLVKEESDTLFFKISRIKNADNIWMSNPPQEEIKTDNDNKPAILKITLKQDEKPNKFWLLQWLNNGKSNDVQLEKI